MNLQFYLEKLHDSENFQEFKKENPSAFLCSGFFVIDKEGEDNKQHFDFFVPTDKKIFSFQLEDGCKKVEVERVDDKVPEEISLNCDFDFGEIERMIESRMFDDNIKNKIQKVLLSLQKLEGKDFIIGTVFISGMGIIKVNIDVAEKKIIHFEKKSFFDMMRIVKKK